MTKIRYPFSRIFDQYHVFSTIFFLQETNILTNDTYREEQFCPFHYLCTPVVKT
jgi:hypothetical protein